jgi:hypothetical protein
MKRKDFIKGLGLTGLASSLSFAPGSEIFQPKVSKAFLPPNCALIPSETEGPFPLDLTANSFYFRQDVRENKTGVQLNLKMKIIGSANCAPMPNVRVNIWHCDKDGLYSGYSQSNNQGQAGLTYLRGYQMTDSNGEVNFVTIFPGWYTGRICHIHFQVYLSSVYRAVSQLTFPIAEKNALYAANASLYTKGADPLTFSSDNIFSDGYNLQLATLTPNATTGGYDTYLEVTVQGSGTTGYAAVEPETGGQFKLGQNFPNPFGATTTVPFQLTNRSDVQIDLFDLDGRKVATVDQGNLMAGDYEIALNLRELGLGQQNYIYQLQVSNEHGVYRQCKMMTASK